MKGSRSASSVGVVLHRPLSSFPRSAGFAVRFLYQCRQLGFLGHRMRSRTAGSVANPNSELGFFGCKPGDITSTEAKGWMLSLDVGLNLNIKSPHYSLSSLTNDAFCSELLPPAVLFSQHRGGAVGQPLARRAAQKAFSRGLWAR